MPLFRQNANIFTQELPSIGNISLAAYVRFIAVKQFYQSLCCQFLKFRQALQLILVMRSIGLSLAAFPYTLILSAKAFKKRRKVELLNVFPLLDSHSALAVCKRWRLALTLSRIPASSWSLSMMGLRPRPDLVYRPAIPSDLYRFSQLFTLISHIFTISATSFDLRPSDLSKTSWQRVRNAWLLPVFKPISNSDLACSFMIGVLTHPIGHKDNRII